jgi:hypothetical protein
VNGKISSAADAMALLADVSQHSTMWSVVYGLQTGDIQIVLGREYDDVEEFELEMMSK